MKKAEKTEMVTTTVRMPRSLLKRVKISAAVNETSMQDLIIGVLTHHCDEDEDLKR